MKVLVLYRPNSEHSRMVEDFARDYQAREGTRRIELMNIDSRDGGATASLYDIMQYPAILVLRDDGSLQNSWVGETFPLMDEVAAYVNV